MAARMAHEVCMPVPHRQYVFTLPKRLRLFFRYDRRLLGQLARVAWETVLEVCRSQVGRRDIVPGMIAGIQTFGELLHYHPHIHAIVTDGGLAPDGAFLQLPPPDTEALLAVWQRKVFELLLAENRIDCDTVRQMKAWPHSGFSVNACVYLPAGDTAGLERLAQYMLRCPFSLARLVRLTQSGFVVYRAEKTDCRRFPEAASADLRGGPSRNFQVFEALDFLAELTQHIPDKGEHLVRYYGCYSHRRIAMRSNTAAGEQIKIDRSRVPASAGSWAALLWRVYEVDPLLCPKCGRPMRVISFIEARQQEVIEKILRHCGLWEGPLRTLAAARAPPSGHGDPARQPVRDSYLVLDPEFAGPTEPHYPPELQLILDPDFF
jgi:hypothetical protein